MSIEEVIEKYQERNGYTIDGVGNVKVEEDAIGEIYKENIVEASRKIGFDISGLNIKQISQVMSQLEYVQDVKDIRIDGNTNADRTVQVNRKEYNLLAICDKLNIQESEYTLDKNSMSMLLSSLDISDKEIKDYIKSYENATLDTFLRNESDVNLIKYLAIFGEIYNTNQYNNINTEITGLQSYLEKYCSDSIFLKNITDENGKFNLDKGLKFFEDFQKQREETDLVNKINRYSTKRELTPKDEKGLIETFVIACARGSEIQKRQVIAIAQTNGIDISDENGNLDKHKIEEYGKKIYGKDFSFEETLEKNTFKGQAAMEELDRIKQSILMGDTVGSPTDSGEVNTAKEAAKWNEKRICSTKEKIIYDVLNSQNALTPLIDFYKNPENAKQVIILFYKFRDEEIKANNPKRDREFNSRSINSGRDDTVSGIIKKYMREREDVFGEYLRSDGSLDPKKVMEILEENEITANMSANIFVAYEQIRNRTNNIEMLARSNGNKEKLKNIDTFLRKSKETELSEEEKNRLYTLARYTPVDILSTETLEELKNLDEEKFKETFKGKQVVKNVGKDSIGAIYFSAAKLFVKGVYALPKMVISKKAKFCFFYFSCRMIISPFITL